MKRNVVVVGLVVLLAVVMGSTGCRRKKAPPIKPAFDETQVTPPRVTPEGDDARDTGLGELSERELAALDMPEEPDAREWLFGNEDRGLKTVYFEFDRSNLTAESRGSLEHNADVLKEYPRYGGERPADLGHDEEAWAENRRDNFRAAD